jgi:opacity protein-like surface antigen
VKKQAFTATSLSALLVTALSAALFVSVGTANPIGWILPYDPHTAVTVQSPADHTTYNVNAAILNFTLDLSEWTPHRLDWNPDYSFSSKVTCILDGHPIWQKTVRNSPQNYTFSIPLVNLSDGLHSITVKANTTGTYWHGTYSSDPVWGGWSWSESTAPVLDSSGIIYFTVNTATQNLAQPFPTILVIASAASVATVTACLLVYFKKSKH